MNKKTSLEQEMEAVKAMFSNGSFKSFSGTLIKEYTELMAEIRAGEYISSGSTIGHEIEGSFLDAESYCLPSPGRCVGGIFGFVKDKLGDISQGRLSIGGELGDFNFEINTEAKTFSGDVFSQEEREITNLLREIENVASTQGLTAYFSGMVETARDADVDLENLILHPSKHLRYLGINHGVISLRGKPLQIDVNGSENSYSNVFGNIMIEALCNSLQTHIKLENPQEDFSRYMNAAMILAAPLVAVAANSPFINSRGPYWRDSRIPVFEQSIDSRTDAERRFNINRNSFPES